MATKPTCPEHPNCCAVNYGRPRCAKWWTAVAIVKARDAANVTLGLSPAIGSRTPLQRKYHETRNDGFVYKIGAAQHARRTRGSGPSA